MPEFPASKNPPRRLSHVYQADHFRFCYCGNSLDATAGLTKYPENDCNLPCPGDPSETCGGNLITEMSRRRQSIILLTTYNITININAVAPPSSSIPLSSTLMSTSSNFSVSIPLTIAPSSTISLSTGFSPSSIAILSTGGPSLSGAPGVGGIPTLVGPVGGSHFFDPGTSSTTPPISLSGSPTPNSSTQRIPIVISSKCHALCLDSLSSARTARRSPCQVSTRRSSWTFRSLSGITSVPLLTRASLPSRWPGAWSWQRVPGAGQSP